MPTLKTHPSTKLHGEITLPGDKSISHRVILFAALAEGQSHIKNLLVAGVTKAMLDALHQLGVNLTLNENTLTVDGLGLKGLRAPVLPINCGNSATTMRLLAGAIAAAGLPVILDGSAGLRRRPMARIVEPLWEMGVPIRARGDGETAPLDIAPRFTSRSLRAIDHHPLQASAQVKTCLLLAGLSADEPLRIHEPAPSRDHTERLLSSMGARIKRVENPNGSVIITLNPQKDLALSPLQLTIPGDISSAAFLIVAALITPGSDITLRDVGLNPTRTGILDALREMGANLEVNPRGERHGEPVGDVTARYSDSLHGIEISGTLVVRMIDEFPIFAVAAAHAQGQTTVRNAAELRHKETDRIQTLAEELTKLGIKIQEHEDGFTIHGGQTYHGGTVSARGDHRLGMSLAVLGLGADDSISIEGSEIINESFPNFADTLEMLGAKTSLIHD